MSGKEKFWVELNICCDLRGKIVNVQLYEDELNLLMRSGKKILEYISTRTAWADLFKKKMPIYLKDVITQVVQELDIESNPVRMNLHLSKESDKLIQEFIMGQGLELKEKKNYDTKPIKSMSADERNFRTELKKKASLTKLDEAILANEDNLESLVYLFSGQTILRKSVFFDLFQHWFETPLYAKKIDELFRQLKNKAGLTEKGPKRFSRKEKVGIIFRYLYLRVIFSKLKRILKRPRSEDEVSREWKKMKGYLKQRQFFNIDNAKVRREVRYEGYTSADFLGKNWLERHFKEFVKLAKFNYEEEEFRQEIREFVKEGKGQGQKLRDIKRSLEKYLREHTILTLIDSEPSDLSSYFLSKIAGIGIWQIRRVIDNNESIVRTLKERLGKVRAIA